MVILTAMVMVIQGRFALVFLSRKSLGPILHEIGSPREKSRSPKLTSHSLAYYNHVVCTSGCLCPCISYHAVLSGALKSKIVATVFLTASYSHNIKPLEWNDVRVQSLFKKTSNETG